MNDRSVSSAIDLGAPESRINLLHKAAIQKIQELQFAIEQFVEMKLPDETKAFLLAELYIIYGQNTKAIEQLEALVNAELQVEIAPEKKDEVKLKLKKANSESEALQEKLKNILDEVQTLRSFTSCGECQAPGGRGRLVWATPNWICKQC
jgi:hypothetical protein